MLEHKDNEMQEIKMQLQNSIRPESLKERVEQIVQREVEERIKQWQLQNQGGDSGGSLEGGSQQRTASLQQQAQYLEKKLKISDEKNDALKSLLQTKDEEIERVLSQKVALTNIFENDLLQMTDKLITHSRGV